MCHVRPQKARAGTSVSIGLKSRPLLTPAPYTSVITFRSIEHMYNTEKNNGGTLFDRIAVGTFSALLAALTALVIPLMFFSVGSFVPLPSVYLYGSIVFTIIMFALGFLLKENILVNIYGKIWNVFYRLFVGKIPKL